MMAMHVHAYIPSPRGSKVTPIIEEVRVHISEETRSRRGQHSAVNKDVDVLGPIFSRSYSGENALVSKLLALIPQEKDINDNMRSIISL